MNYLTVQVVAARLAFKPKTIIRLIRQRRLVGLKIGRVWRVDEDSVSRFLREAQAQGERNCDRPQGKPGPLPTAGRYVHLPPRKS